MAERIEGGDVRFSFSGDASGLNSELSKVSGNLDGVVNASQGAANDLDKKLGKAADNAGGRMKGLSEQAGDSDSILKGLSGTLGLIDPRLEAAANTAGELGGGLEAVARSAFQLNPIALALGAAAAALAFAWFEASGAAEDAETAMEDASAAASEAEKIWGDFKNVLTTVGDEFAVLSGALTQVEVDLQKATRAIEAGTNPAILKQNKRIIETKQALEAVGYEHRKRLRDSDDIDKMRDKEARLTKQLEKQKDALAALETKRETGKLQAEFILETKEAERKKIDEIRASEKALAETRRVKAKLQAEALQLARAREAAIKSLTATENASVKGSLEGADLILETRRQEIAKLDEIRELHKGAPEVLQAAAGAEVAIREKANDDLADLDKKTRAENKKDRDKEADERLSRAEKDAAAQRAVTEELFSVIGDVNDEMMDRQGSAASASAKAVFAISKAAALANIALKIQEGLVAAAALPPPADFIKGGVVLATGALATASVAAQQAPTFHAGGRVGAPDEVNARLLRGEGVINSRGMATLGDEGLAAINRGEPGGGGVTVVNTYKHRVFDAFVADNVKRTGSPLRRAINRDRKVGQVSRD